jgi:cytochrome c-type biogenesis protein
MDLILAYLAGLLTLINPCVLPVLPIVLASALQAHRLGPLALAAGMAGSFVVLGLTIAAAGQALGLSDQTVAQAGAVLMIGFGLILLVPRLNEGFATATAGFSARADTGIDRIDRSGLGGQALAGVLLGAVWSPCVGPTLGGAISLASQGQSLVWAGAVMAAFAAGVASVILALGYGARAALARRRTAMRALAERAKPIMGVIFVAVGLAILFRLHHLAEAWLVNTLPAWLVDLSVSL